MAGQYQAAIEDYQRALQFSEKKSELFKELGLTYVLKNEFEIAIIQFEQAITLGYTDKNWLLTEEALAPLRELPYFQELLDRIPDE